MADKMSDYEDIWLDTLPKHQAKVQMAKYKFLQNQPIQQQQGSVGQTAALVDERCVVGQGTISPVVSERERSITPAESESHFKVTKIIALLLDWYSLIVFSPYI